MHLEKLKVKTKQEKKQHLSSETTSRAEVLPANQPICFGWQQRALPNSSYSKQLPSASALRRGESLQETEEKREQALKGKKSFEDVHRKLFQGYLLDCTIISMGSIKALKNMRNIKPCQRVMKINSKELFCSGLPGQLHNLPHLLHGKVLLHLNAGEPRQFPPRLDLPKRKSISLCSAQVYQLLLAFLFQFISSLSQKHQHLILL